MAPGRAGWEPGGHGRAQCVRSVVLCVRFGHETNGKVWPRPSKNQLSGSQMRSWSRTEYSNSAWPTGWSGSVN